MFQFTRPQGARHERWTDVDRRESFNSRAHTGRDQAISETTFLLRLFQFTRPQGARQVMRISFIYTTEFQFTRPQGARHHGNTVGTKWICFNSRAHKGRDFGQVLAIFIKQKFQFTRPQGARPLAKRTSVATLPFQFTRPQGARHYENAIKSALGVFQFTRPQGARQTEN